ncbi:radical SAM protein [Blautia pseudococcoides]|uniref:radical SAM/SPASM domain-containing protein n=1 Tax=Blautia pseudococcoides TaxID=1796616 RepID=UPI00148AEE03|nr:radical SAM/SPASM domain-containing protein [Blautia pseudococcoides]QJU13848.1 radical SAM protein [Blautia pseudococcoides]
MEYKSCGILLTENCNARCKMCCDSRGHVRGKTLSKEELTLILENIKECKSINVIGITGGEPMLYPDLIEYIFNYNYGRKMDFTIKTNGFWGKDTEKAREFIVKYKDKIKNLSFSYDEFHKEFIDIQNIINIINIADELEVSTEVVGCFLRSGMTPGEALDLLGDCAYKTTFAWQPVIKTGSALTSFSDDKFYKIFNTDKHEARCIGLLDRTLLINPQLNVYPCCSQVIENTLLLVGNLKNERLKDIINNINCNKVFYEIYTKGFAPFLELLDKKGIEYPHQVTSACEYCQFFFHNDWFLHMLKEEKYFETI